MADLEQRHEVVYLYGDEEKQLKRKGPVDYVLKLRFTAAGTANPGLNFLVTWGWPILAPVWAGLQYDYTIETKLTLTRPVAGEQANPLLAESLSDSYNLAYTPMAWGMVIYVWDWGIFSSVLTGLDDLTSVHEIEPVEEAFAKQADLMKRYVRRVVNRIENAIADDPTRPAPSAP